MYAAYSNWVQSHRDLPIKVNQWCNMIRWEVKQTTPFLRMRENLWQEGHTAFAERAPAEAEVRQILELYARIYEELLALPVIRGKKTVAETFPGADYTTTVECYIGATGRAIQGATSHHLGQRFSKMFDISFQDPKDPAGKAREFAYQNSWGLTTRTIGVMIMVHGDDRGLVMPPGVAGLQVVIVPVGLKASMSDAEKQELMDVCASHAQQLEAAGLRVKFDDNSQKSPGNKFNYWEMKGVPLRIEVGPSDVAKGEFVMSKRNVEPTKDSKITANVKDLVTEVQRVLSDITTELYSAALQTRNDKIANVDDWADFTPSLNQKKLLLVPFCGVPACEEAIKEKSKAESEEVEIAGGLKMGAKSLCIPFEDKYNVNCPMKCIHPDCKNDFTQGPMRRVLFGRSY
jgi:bifunctional glutamyl/prolyl-tRNA synthetase